jgi:hypothetical protein
MKRRLQAPTFSLSLLKIRELTFWKILKQSERNERGEEKIAVGYGSEAV